jgi:uncharacterized membrane protein
MTEHTVASEEAERNTLLVAYVLYALAPFTAITGIAGVIINHIKVVDTDSPFIRSHHRWLLHTFWFGLLWSIVAIPLVLLMGLGVLIYIVVFIWYIYRVVRGIINFTERRPMSL